MTRRKFEKSWDELVEKCIKENRSIESCPRMKLLCKQRQKTIQIYYQIVGLILAIGTALGTILLLVPLLKQLLLK